MCMSFLAIARNFLFTESTGEVARSLWNFIVELFWHIIEHLEYS